MAFVSVAMASSSDQPLVVGGGLAGRSAANAFLENGGRATEGRGDEARTRQCYAKTSGADVEWLMDKFSSRLFPSHPLLYGGLKIDKHSAVLDSDSCWIAGGSAVWREPRVPSTCWATG